MSITDRGSVQILGDSFNGHNSFVGDPQEFDDAFENDDNNSMNPMNLAILAQACDAQSVQEVVSVENCENNERDNFFEAIVPTPCVPTDLQQRGTHLHALFEYPVLDRPLFMTLTWIQTSQHFFLRSVMIAPLSWNIVLVTFSLLANGMKKLNHFSTKHQLFSSFGTFSQHGSERY